MVQTLRPSRHAFEDAGWLSKSEDSEVFQVYIDHLDKPPYPPSAPALLPAVEKFKKFVDDTATVRMDFERMFENAKDEVNIVYYLPCSSLHFLSLHVF